MSEKRYGDDIEMDVRDLLTGEQASKYIGYNLSTLRVWRSTGHGPAYYRSQTGRITYSIEDLDNFKKLRRVVPVPKRKELG